MWDKDKYRRPRTYLYYRYRDMLARVNGKTAGDRKSQLWLGLPIESSREAFIEWAIEDENFVRLHAEWAASGYPRRLAPSVHRVNRQGGYTLDNIEFRSHHEKALESTAKGHATRAARKTATA